MPPIPLARHLPRVRDLIDRGVGFTEPPEERFYGIDASFRDPFANAWRLTRLRGLEQIREAVAGSGST